MKSPNKAMLRFNSQLPLWVILLFFVASPSLAIAAQTLKYSLGAIIDNRPPSIYPSTHCPAGKQCALEVARPSQIDYRQQGIVTPVKDQGNCGSCAVFAAYAALESRLIRDGYHTDLAEQYLLSCRGVDICNNIVYHTVCTAYTQ